MRWTIIAAAAALAATGALAQEFGGEEDRDYAAQLWQAMSDRNFIGEDAVMAFPYEGTDPHGMMLETFYTDATVGDHTGALVIKRNYGPEGVTVDQVLGSPGEHLGAVTIMYRREQGYDPETNNWFWAKYLPDGALDQNPNGVPLAGRVAKNAGGEGQHAGCIGCHQGAGGDDYLFTTDASVD